jgi:hypothetical protein
VGFDAVRVWHMNDAKAARGSKLDRHEQIGKGTMGLEPFRRLLNDKRFAHAAFIAETPVDAPGDEERNVRNAGARPLAEALAAVDTPEGRKRVADVLDRQPFPHYKQCSDQPGLLIRIDEDSTETIGRFVDRTFVASEGGSALWGQPVPEIKPRSAKKSLRKKSASFRVKRPPSPPSREKAA